MPLTPGLVSVTFRHLPVGDVGRLAAANGLRSIEWGADVHVPPGDDAAADAALATGAEVAAYGSYYWAGDDDPADFAAVLRTAVRLGAPTVRIWAGRVGSVDADGDRRFGVADAIRAAAQQAAEHGITVSLEYHANTLTDSVESTVDLLDRVDHPGALSYWQPPNDTTVRDALDQLGRLKDRLSNIHVFTWWPGYQRRPLAFRADLWRAVFGFVPDGRHALLEFVADDDPANLPADAATLLELLP